jgi:hypothetical protein
LTRLSANQQRSVSWCKIPITLIIETFGPGVSQLTLFLFLNFSQIEERKFVSASLPYPLGQRSAKPKRVDLDGSKSRKGSGSGRPIVDEQQNGDGSIALEGDRNNLLQSFLALRPLLGGQSG